MKAKTSTKHPYAATEHRVIDSPAYADLSFSARSLLVLLTRQLSKDNNGHLQATFSYMQRFGFDAERTLRRAIADLIAHGIVYRTRSGGYQQGAAQYAVTWLPIKQREGLFLDGFKLCAWRDWEPSEKKPPAKIPETHGNNGMRTPLAHAKNTAARGAKSTDIELMPCSSRAVSYLSYRAPASANWIPTYLSDRAERGLSDLRCFREPAWKAPQ